ncbi:MAG: glycosyltransferase family 2 protein [candidate division WOR-3 bacterium]
MKPTVSIIIPTYNRANLLKRAIESILKQDYENIKEIIITDDGSTDNTKEIVKEFQERDKRIIFVENTKYKKGPTGNKNNGLDYATGDFVGILDDDDELLPDAISKLIDIHLKFGYKHIFANCLRSDTKEFTGKSYGKSEEVKYEDILCGKYEGEYWGIVSRDLIGKERFFDDTYGGESLLWWKLYKKTPAFYLNEPIRIYYVEDEMRVSKKYLKFPERSFLNYKYTLDLYGDDLLKFCPKKFIKICFLAAFFARIGGKYFKALKYTVFSFKTQELFFLKIFALFLFFLPIPSKILIFLYQFFKRFKKIF